MRNATIIGLGLAAIVAAGAATLVVQNRNASEVAQAAGFKILPEIGPRLNDVALIEVSTATKGNFSLKRDGDNWVMPEKGGYPAKADKIKKTIIGLAEMTALEPRTENPDLYGRIGVQDPGTKVAAEADAKGGEKGPPAEPLQLLLKDASGKDITGIILGRVKGFEVASRPAEINVRKVGDKRSWLASVRLDPTADAVDWVERAMVKVKRDDVAEVIITQTDGTTTRLYREKPDAEGFTLDKVPAGHTVTAPFEINAIAQALEFNNLQDVRRFDAAQFAKPVIALYKLKNGLALTVRTVSEDGKFWAVFDVADGAAADDDARKMAAELHKGYDGWAFQITDNIGKDLTRRTADLIKKEEPAEKKDAKK